MSEQPRLINCISVVALWFQGINDGNNEIYLEEMYVGDSTPGASAMGSHGGVRFVHVNLRG